MAALNSDNISCGLKMFAGSKGKLDMTARIEPFTGADRALESSTEE
jgi:hypothetical protein